ncbi:MAG: ABC transporter ATP-binding protein [Deltaproteobacteria bacterium]|nr:ABC transporter ATP-binding protein [Deltaproteobacteria bacterium]
MSLEIKDLNVIYQDGIHCVQALEDVSLTVAPGKCLALVGESGSGKTTVAKACMGLLPSNAARQGQIKLDRQRIDQLGESLLNEIRWERIGMVFQHGAANLNPVHQIINQVAEPLIQHRSLSRREAHALAGEALVQMGLKEGYHSRYPHQLSGGEAQRALLAMAMILDPELIILDEPTSALDALSKSFVTGSINRAKERGKAILLITHDLELVVHVAETVAFLYLGQIMETMPARDIFTQPLHPYTLALGRSYPAMNTTRDLGGIRGDAFYRFVHQHGHNDEAGYRHSHIQVPLSSHKDGHAPPTGCLFQNRCTQTIERCRTEKVDLEAIGDHTVRCIRHGIANLLELKGVSKKYENTVAINAMDLTIKCGEVFCLVGETGSGKTTLAMIAAGVIKPESGSRVFDGRDMDEWMHKGYPSLATQVGVIYQNPAESVSHRFSVFDIVAEALKIHGLSQSREEMHTRVTKALADVHLSTDPAFLGRYAHELNMGAIQRVCLARALVLGPSFLVADEPTSSLDPSVQAKVLKLLLDLQIEMGLTMFFVTHDIGLARKIGDRIGVMLSGRLVETGPAHLILSSPYHRYTQLLIDSVSGISHGSFQPGSDPVEPGGCPFATRCPRATDLCRLTNPQLLERDHRQVACHFPLTSRHPG